MTKYIASITPERNTLILDAGRLFGVSSGSVTMTVTPVEPSDAFSTFVNGIKDEDEKVIIYGGLYIDSVRYTDCPSNGIMSNASPYIFSIRIDPDNGYFAEGVLKVKFTGINNSANFCDVIVYVSMSDVSEISSPESLSAECLSGPLKTRMLMRTNPRLTGNIKLVVDSQGHLYLDTFYVTNVLEQKKYRKYPVSSEGNYPHDVMTVFSSLPQGELFKVPTESLNPHKFYSDYEYQYRTEYEYGAETSSDDLYTENMRILAPLHLGKGLPEFFCIFRYEGVYNKETYQSAEIDDLSKYKELISESEVVKIFDLRTYTAIGKYLSGYSDMISDFLHGSCFLQFIEQDNELYGENYRQGNNSWRGIDIDRGIITNKIESSYFANKILTSGSAVQENYDQYIINGYERNNILYPYILNLEFMFNDESKKEFSMHRYFGLYLSSNELVKYGCVVSEEKDGQNIVMRLDDKDSAVDESVYSRIFNESFNDRLFFMTTNNDAARVVKRDDIETFISKYVCNNPDVNIGNVTVSPLKFSDEAKSFMTMTFTKPVAYGEHFRFIAQNLFNEEDGSVKNICLEIVASNDERLLEEDGFVSPYVYTNSPDEVISSVTPDSVPNEVYRMAFYTQDTTDSTLEATLEEQIARIRTCISRFASFVRVSSWSSDTIGFVSSHEDVKFQHILAPNKERLPEFGKMYFMTSDSSIDICYSSRSDVDTLDYVSWVKRVKEYVNPSFYCELTYDSSAYSSDDRFYTYSDPSSAVSYVDFADDSVMIEDTIRYFSKTTDTLMRPLNPDTVSYSPSYGAFSLFGFESLGWRWASLVSFKKSYEMNFPYAVYDDIEKILKVYRHPLMKTVDGKFLTLRPCTFSTGYVTDNPAIACNCDIKFYSQDLYMTETEENTILNPFDVKTVVLDFYAKPFIHNSTLGIFSPESASACIMGVFPVSDLDMSVNFKQTETVKNTTTVTIPKNEVVDLLSSYDRRLSQDVLYEIESGSFEEYSMKRFIYSGDTLYYTKGEGKESVDTSFYDGCLKAASDVVLKIVDGGMRQEFSYQSSSPVHTDDNFFVYPSDKANSALNSPVVPSVGCFWESNGLYLDDENSLNVDDLVTDEYHWRGYFTEHSQSPLTTSNGREFIRNSVDSYVKDSSVLSGSFRDAILSGKLKNIIKTMITSGNYPETAVGYYNSYVQSLEFIYYGIKFSLKFNSEYYTQNIRIGEYNNFDVYFINDYNPTVTNELFISVDEEIIVFVNHIFDMGNTGSLYTSVKKVVKKVDDASINKVDDASINSNIYGSVPYSVSNSPYNINSDTICGFGSRMFVSKSNDSVAAIGEGETCGFVQEELPISSARNDENIKPHFIYFPLSGDDSTDIFNIDTAENSVGILRKTDSSIYVASFSSTLSTDKDLTVSKSREPESFIIRAGSLSSNIDYSDSEVMRERMKEYISSVSGKDLMCYIIYNGEVDTINVTEKYRPLSVTMQIPQRIKYNFGYFRPKMYDILTFSSDDLDLSETTGMNLLLANTKIESTEKIKSYFGNKVFSRNNNVSISKNYFDWGSKSVFSSNWDSKYYRSYSSEEDYTLLNGYIPGIEDKSFFGSRCMVLHEDSITVDDFSAARVTHTVEYIDSLHNVYSENLIQCRIKINITQAIYALFEANETFCKNWDGLSSDIDTARGNYISNSVFKIFNSQRKRDIIVYGKSNGTDEMKVDFDSSPEGYDSWEKIENFSTEMSVVDNEMILTLTISVRGGTTLHPQVKIYRN